GVDADAHRDTGVVAATDLVEHDGGVAPVEPCAAPPRIVAQPEHAELAHLPVERLVEAALAIELARARNDLLLDELPHRRAEQLMLGTAIEIIAHGADLTVPSGGLPAPPFSFRAARRGYPCREGLPRVHRPFDGWATAPGAPRRWGARLQK